MNTTRSYNENYYITRKKILENFEQEEDREMLEYAEGIENLVSSTKLALKNMVMGDTDFKTLNDKILLLEKELEQECEMLTHNISTLSISDKHTASTTVEIQKQEEKGMGLYLDRIESLKKEMELKEFKIQNMERLYVELENIIKENIRIGSEQLLTLDQFIVFVAQNEKLHEENKCSEAERKNMMNDYNLLLRENINLRSKNESFELEKVKDALEEISSMGQLQAESQLRINTLQGRFNELTKECSHLTNQIVSITKNLEGLNIDNIKLNQELSEINKELLSSRLVNTNKSFSETYNYESNSLFTNGNYDSNKQKSRTHVKSTIS
jgi:hypothetical protein